MKAFTIAGINLRRFVRDRSNVFWVFIFPILLILVLGSAFGGSSDPRLGIHNAGTGPLAADLVALLRDQPGLQVMGYESRNDLVATTERGEIEAGLLIPGDYDSALQSGVPTSVDLMTRGEEEAQGIRGNVQSILTQQSVVLRAAGFVASEGVGSFAEGLDSAQLASANIVEVTVKVSEVGEQLGFLQLGRFDSSAQQQLLLFVFLTSLSQSAALIQTRRLGVARRMVSTPTPVRTILAGEGLGRYAIALLQGLFIMVGTLLFFNVDWGDPIGAAAILVVFSLVGSGAAMLMGALFDNDQQAGGLGVLFSLGLAALGGCMVPLIIFEFFAPTLFNIAHITPHAWGLEAFDALVIENGTVVDTLPYLGILLAYAAVFYLLAIWRLRRVLTH
jgi:ABC-2 type transport system permease protein